VRDGGLNSSAQSLTFNESVIFQNSPELQNKVIKSYELMLDFYGLKLIDDKVGKLENNSNYKKRFEFLNKSSHNYLR
jgi:hypothetical protein